MGISLSDNTCAEVVSVGKNGAEHVHDFHQIVLGINGFADYRINGEADRVSGAIGCIIPADFNHYFIGHEDCEVLVINIGKKNRCLFDLLAENTGSGQAVQSVSSGANDHVESSYVGEFFQAPQAFQINTNFRRLYTNCAKELNRFSDEKLVQYTSNMIMRSIFVRVSNSQCQKSQHHRINVEELRTWVTSNLGQKITVNDIAEQACMSNSRFHVCFLAITGKTPHQFVLEIRLQSALEKIRNTSDAFSNIADEVGFSSQGAMTNVFQKHFGFSPLMLRKRYANTLFI